MIWMGSPAFLDDISKILDEISHSSCEISSFFCVNFQICLSTESTLNTPLVVKNTQFLLPLRLKNSRSQLAMRQRPSAKRRADSPAAAEDPAGDFCHCEGRILIVGTLW